MPRAIYQKAIYKREKQLTRKVYQRKNNVIPVISSYYVVTNVEMTNPGMMYEENDTMSIQGNSGDTPAVITVVSASPIEYEVSRITLGAPGSGYAVDDTFTVSAQNAESATIKVSAVDTLNKYTPNDDPATVTITNAGLNYVAGTYHMSNGSYDPIAFTITVDGETGAVTSITPSGPIMNQPGTTTVTSDNLYDIEGGNGELAFTFEWKTVPTSGCITELTIEDGGTFQTASTSGLTITDNSLTGSGATFTVNLSATATSGQIESFSFTEGSYATNLSGSFELVSQHGAGATFTVTMAQEIIGDDENISNSNENPGE